MAAASGSGAPPPPPNNNPFGFLNQRPGTTRVSKIKWEVHNDRKLMLIIMGRDIQPNEFQAIANSFPERPTAKAIQERIAKLRRLQNAERDRMQLAQAPMEVPEGISDEDRAAAAMAALGHNFG
ncbi:hypothetical protein LTR09_012011 [Extremus antarcticus]|uniref:Uncharacterized protein n=1 Tax=Extremus antarcticus TaxID=702011 RepID=A0AAJ0D5N5_9PEZI|nr:hypothetical protein LTR09_012011 [Extremus antarcticus]